jgi:hypothetical protein
MAINPPVINITKPEDAYPGLRAYVKEKRKEGLDDLAITGRIMDWMKEARDQGYSDEEINAKVSGPKLELPKSSWGIPGIAKFAYRGFTEPATPEKQKSLESGFWKGITLGYGQEYDYEPTYGNITADVVGQLMGTVSSWLWEEGELLSRVPPLLAGH